MPSASPRLASVSSVVTRAVSPSSAERSVCQGRDAHFTRTGNSHTPEKDASLPRSGAAFSAAREKAAVLSFVVEGVHPHDMGTVLDYDGVAVRTGHHCAQPVMERFGVPATTRASLAVYNTKQEIDVLVAGIEKAREMFA